ncbi:ABC-F family ATP-binding cassette domain-containing protein [Limosilactobacillus gastricus]|uniref:ABC-F family ATP-binding cassette domain-containing protein n=1 Tax=Limosilactobacillus gastricus TaxID=227942 RepID=UPI0026F0A77B|nr:ABC-F family ATP-binding cassette domain-containing protein [Limosilactobacillus gastricus]
MLLLQTNNVERRFGADTLFHKINLQINDHARIALVGRNGAGKTTLLRIIAGITTPDEGEVTTIRDLTIGYLAQDQGLDSQNSIWAEMDSVFAPLHQMEAAIHDLESQLATIDPTSDDFANITGQYDQLQTKFQSQGGYEINSKIRGVLTGFGFTEQMYDQPVTDLSGGQKTKLALAKILLERPQLLILDEPTNHLDMNVLTWLESYLKTYRGALLIVSHDRYFLDQVVNEVYDLDQKTLRHYTGNYSQFVDHKADWLQSEMKHYDQQQKEIAKLEDFVNRNLVRASTTKRAQSRRKQLEKMERMERPTTDDRSIHFQFHSEHESGNEVLEVDQLSIGYHDQKIAGPLSFTERKGQRLGIIGPNGIGKSTLLKTILNLLPPISGTVKLGANLEIGYYDQEQQQLHPEKTVLDEVWDEHPEVDETEIRTLLGSFLFIGDDVYKQVKDLSGGQKARLELTKLSFQPMNFLVLDEPTNHLDIDSREVLETAINEFTGTVLFVSHDRYFINQVATQLVAIHPDHATSYEGDYDDYLAALDQSHDQVSEKTTNEVSKPKQESYQATKEIQRERRKLQRKVDEYEETMEKLDQQITRIQETMNQPEVASDIAKLTDLQKELDHYQAQADESELAWTEAAEALESFDQDN